MRNPLIWPVLIFGTLSGCAENQVICNTATWQELVASHEARYPGLAMPDVYKLLHQATMGSEHAAPSVAEATSWMNDEVAHLGIGPSESLQDTLGVDGRFVRIHLRPYLALGGVADSLVTAFVATGKRFPPDTVALKCALESWRAMTPKDTLWQSDSLGEFLAERARSGYQAIEHSDTFVARYHPAYRVVARELLPLWRRGRF